MLELKEYPLTLLRRNLTISLCGLMLAVAMLFSPAAAAESAEYRDCCGQGGFWVVDYADGTTLIVWLNQDGTPCRTCVSGPM